MRASVADPRFHPVNATGAHRGPHPIRPARERRSPCWSPVPWAWARYGAGRPRTARSGAAVPVVVRGRNEELARADGIEHVHGGSTTCRASMHAADVLVQNAGGLTSPRPSPRACPSPATAAYPVTDSPTRPLLTRRRRMDPGPGPTQHVLAELIDGPRGLPQREAGPAPACGRGPLDWAAGKDTRAHQDPTTGAYRGPAAETVRVCRAGAGPATPITVRRTRPTALRLSRPPPPRPGAVRAGRGRHGGRHDRGRRPGPGYTP
ncbi:hypothetical protein ACRAWF_21150 [Streptomyces sp. L7]